MFASPSSRRASCPLTSPDAANGFFQIVGRDLFFIKTRHTGTGRVEIHSATPSGYGSGQDHVTALPTAGAIDGRFEMTGAELYFIKTTNTASGRIEIQSSSAASGYQTVTQQGVSRFPLGDEPNGAFQIIGGLG